MIMTNLFHIFLGAKKNRAFFPSLGDVSFRLKTDVARIPMRTWAWAFLMTPSWENRDQHDKRPRTAQWGNERFGGNWLVMVKTC